MSHFTMLHWYYLFFRPKIGSESVVACITWELTTYSSAASRYIDHSQIAVRFKPVQLTVVHSFPELI